MIWFIISIVIILMTLAWFVFAPADLKVDTSYGQPDKYVNLKPFGLIGVVLAVLLMIPAFSTVVSTRSVGVPTTFNKPTGETMGAGFHLKAPWVSVTDIDGSIQPEEYKGDDCIYVKLGDGGTSCVSVAYRWRINPDAADTVFSDYRNSDLEINEAVRKALVSTNMKAAINEVFATFDPLAGADLSTDMTVEELSNLKVNVNPDIPAFNKAVEENFDSKIANLADKPIDLVSVTISYVKMPETTQKRIDAFNQSVQNTKIALQDVATKRAQAEGNRELAESLQDPNVLVAQCINGLVSGDIANQPGFTCWPGGSNGVVIPGTK